MKYFLLILSVVLLSAKPWSTLSTVKITAQESQSIQLEINGILVLDGKEVTNYSYCLHHNGLKMDSAYKKKMKAFTVTLQKNEIYTLSYHKVGYADKYIMIDTHIPAGKELLEQYEVAYEMELNPALCKHKEEFKDHPVAIVKYFKNKNDFDFSTKYHEAIHHKGKTIKKVEID